VNVIGQHKINSKENFYGNMKSSNFEV